MGGMCPPNSLPGLTSPPALGAFAAFGAFAVFGAEAAAFAFVFFFGAAPLIPGLLNVLGFTRVFPLPGRYAAKDSLQSKPNTRITYFPILLNASFA